MYRAAKIAVLVLMLWPLPVGRFRLQRSVPSEPAPVARILRSALRQIENKSTGPILLPSELPASMHPDEITFAEGSVTRNGWEVSLAYNREAAEARSAGGLWASIGRTPDISDFDKVVRLANGIKGYYRGKSCGGSCTPPEIDWIYAGALYGIQLTVHNKSAKRDEAEMIAVANSAISGGPR